MGNSLMGKWVGGLGRVLALGALVVSGLAQAQSGPVKLMVGFPPGGGTDAIARVLADKLKDQLGVTVLVDNKAGAGGQIAAQALKAGDEAALLDGHGHPALALALSSAGNRWARLA